MGVFNGECSRGYKEYMLTIHFLANFIQENGTGTIVFLNNPICIAVNVSVKNSEMTNESYMIYFKKMIGLIDKYFRSFIISCFIQFI